ncbi:NAD-dependent DNA ligase LigA, partial [Pelagibacterales bacterium SAG-MED01]|nr:NAD-dependent DNA ligase LigA [Pelagibacterales bacterium SAG-MED01]
MNKNLIKKRYKEKIKSLNHYNKKYFDDNVSEISDANFDKLKKEIFNLEKKYKFLKDEDSPSNKIGFKPSKNFKKVSHRVPMLSLSNAFGEEDLINFEKKIRNYLNEKNIFQIEYSAE